MTPKIIHYCWFGSKPKNKLILGCIDSWEKYCPDFEIIEWNENNTKKYQNKFYKDSYRKKKYAFASDCIRSQVLFEYGGIYLDSDMVLLKPISELLDFSFFTGYEVKDRPAYGLFGGIPKHRFFKLMVDFYCSTEFNEFSLPVITHTFKNKIHEKTLVKGEIIFSPDYFYSLTYENRDNNYNQYITESSYAVHLWDHSWNANVRAGYHFYIRGLKTVIIDFLFYGYSKAYFIRYFRGFLRQVYYLIVGKK